MNDIRKAPVMIPVEKLRPFDGHPYKVIDNEEMNNLIDSIQEQGILSPLIVRPIENTTDKYEVVSGHRRFRAAEKAGMEEIPAFIYAFDRDAAAIAVVDSNLHREHILPSEKAFSYKMKMDAMSHQGKRSDITSGQLVPKSDDRRTAAEIGAVNNESYKTVQRYIRLTYLIPELLEYMDDGKMALSVGVELSYLGTDFQYAVLDAMAQEDCTPSYAQAIRMRKLFRDDALTDDEIYGIMCEEKANQKENVKIPTDRIRKYFPKEYTTAQIEETIVKLCEAYHRKRLRDRDER